MWVLAKIDMPGHENDIDVRMWQEPTVDGEESQRRIDEHGVSIASYGRLSGVTDIRKKRRHLAVHLDGGVGAGGSQTCPGGSTSQPKKFQSQFPDSVRIRR